MESIKSKKNILKVHNFPEIQRHDDIACFFCGQIQKQKIFNLKSYKTKQILKKPEPANVCNVSVDQDGVD